MNESYKRVKGRRSLKNVLIYPDFQLKFIVWMIVASLIIVFFFGTTSFLWFKKMHAEGSLMGLPETHPYFALLENFIQSYLKILIASLFLTVLVCISLGLILSHRIAGPLVKLRNHFLRISQQSMKKHNSKIFFRKNDFFKDLAAAYNESTIDDKENNGKA